MKHKTAYILLNLVIVFPFALQTKADNKLNNDDTHETVLFDFINAAQLEPWRIVNDGVMGGLSQSRLTHSDKQTAIFEGTVSLENNGGFTSTRTLPKNYHLKGYAGIQLRVKGDGKNYQFRLRSNDRFDGVSYRHQFTTEADTWTIVDLPFNKFIPVFRGRILQDVEPITPESIQQLGFLIANKRSEQFQLEIDWIKAYKQN